MKRNLHFVISILLLTIMILTACSFPSRNGDNASPEAASGENSSAEGSEDSQQDAPPEDTFDPDEMENKLNQFVIRDEDLPHDYRLPPNAEFMLPTATLINEMGELAAKGYISSTGRINGWGIHLERVNKEDFAPVDMESRIELFKTGGGAALAISPEYFPAYQGDSTVTWVDGGCTIGDECLFYFSETHDPTTDLTKHRYEVAFVYRNVLVWVMGRGLDIDVTPEYILDAAETLYQKLDDYAQNQ
jgi:hypothetical protein